MRFRPACRLLLWWVAVLGAAQWACVGGHIPPTLFRFTPVVPYAEPEGGGWKVAQVLVLLGKISTRFSSAATCDIEVGVPERNMHGWVLDEAAQVAAAKAADQAARLVLKEQLPTALACIAFRQHMQRILADPVSGSMPGARVTGFQRKDVPRVTFP